MAYGPYGAAALLSLVVFAAVLRRAQQKKDAGASRSSSAVTPAGDVVSTTVTPPASLQPPVPRIVYDEVDDEEATNIGAPAAGAAPPVIKYEEDAAVDEPTGARPLIVLSASARTDKGFRRHRNEDRILALESRGIFAIADGMGGVRGGEIASELAVSTLRETLDGPRVDGDIDRALPRRAAEVTYAISKANTAILERARAERELRGMGTTMSVARFAPKKQRLYIGHVGDSRVYRLRQGHLEQMTRDHTMHDLGVAGDEAKNLSRALGVWARVPIDVIVAKPVPGDVYLLCSDGLTKMVAEDRIRKVLDGAFSLKEAAEALVTAANAAGGADNVSVVVVRVDAPSALALGA